MRKGPVRDLATAAAMLWLSCAGALANTASQSSNGTRALQVEVNPRDGKYSISMPSSRQVTLRAGIAAQVDDRWLRASDYPKHTIEHSQVEAYLGSATDWKVTYSGLAGEPELIYHLRTFLAEPFLDIQVTVKNSTGKSIRVSDIRSVDIADGPVLDLGGPADEDRVLSDSFSEDRPRLAIRDLTNTSESTDRAVGSQLIYNKRSRESLFIGALTSDKFLTILRLHLAPKPGNSPQPTAYEVDSSGTTELEVENSLKESPAQDRIELRLPVEPGADLSSERLLIGLSNDYHNQLETYGSLIRKMHHTHDGAPPLMGWWSWATYYFGLNEGAALTTAQWEAEHLKPLGYNVYLVDEGYQYARGEYTTPDASLFPHGMASVYYTIHGLGLLPAVWTAPFEVSVRSWVYEHHPDWLVKNADGKPIHAGSVVDGKDPLFVLDTTNPEAQAYLRMTYSTLVNEWGIRFIKMDFMDDTAVEGFYFKPNTTALEAQRTGLQIIRDAVGNDVYLDKDGSPMLNAVGYVDYGRISQDTAHTFGASKEAATGIAARYYMNRNFYVSDPDAFTVSPQMIEDQSWHKTLKPASLDDAEVSIALAAISGGMFEIGDDLTTLSRHPERLALIENQDLINMIRLGKASVPLDLMTYDSEDEQPSIFLLKENARQTMLTIFNWSDKEREHSLHLEEIGLSGAGQYAVNDILDKKRTQPLEDGALTVHLPPHSVRVLKLVDESIPASAPTVTIDHPSEGRAGDALAFLAQDRSDNPVLSYEWQFGDGVTLEGRSVTHTFTEPGDFKVRLTATGVTGPSIEESFQMHISGHMPTTFEPQRIRRYTSGR